jgi:Ca-activated chloride channel family protein
MPAECRRSVFGVAIFNLTQTKYTGNTSETIRFRFCNRMSFMLRRGIFLCSLLLLLNACSRSSDDGKATNTQVAPANVIEIVFTYGSEKQNWIDAVTAKFNQSNRKISNGKIIQVKTVPMGSGECIDELLDGRRKAHLTSPASGAFIKLGNAKSRTKTGKDLIGSTENLVLSPVVIAMWKPMAETIGWGKKPIGWSDVLQLAQNTGGWGALGHPEWGSFKFGHTHPQFSNSGLTATFAEVYAATGKVAGLTPSDIQEPKTAQFLNGIEKSVVHYGSSTGFFGRKMFENGPEYLSAAVLYENMVIESYSKNNLPFPVVAIYPKEGTFWSDHPVGIVEREWVTPEHREAAKIYIQYLLDRPQQEQALQFGFRPSSVDIPLHTPVDVQHGVDPREPKTTLEVPTVECMDAILRSWQENKKHSDVVLVFDTSGSMKDENRMSQARPGAMELLSLLGDSDYFSLLLFNNSMNWSSQGRLLKESRPQITQVISGLFPGGGTALYDAIDSGYQYLLTNRKATHISAVVVLTDGDDTDSRLSFDQLQSRIRFDSETRTIRVFTIGYGSGAQKDLLKKIADITNARFYEGTPENIKTVFQDISTFF